jgi:predicted TIM-barrel fold metal-dependent hydrolase
MYKHPDYPRKATIIQARDHLVEQNPSLRVVGAHLGSLEVDLDGLGQRLDRFPNFAVDLAARVAYLALAPREKVRQFMIKYQDRLLYGTDLEFFTRESTATAITDWEKRYATDWAFFSSTAQVEYNKHTVEGLNLPAAVLHKLYHDNAVRWIPGVIPQAR